MENRKNSSFCNSIFKVLLVIICWNLIHNPLFAAPCEENVHVRYASSNNRLYVENGGDCTLEEVSALEPAQLVRTENGSADIFLLRAYLYVEDGSTLRIYGPDAGGEVGQFRLLSSNSDNEDFIFVTADWGTIDIVATEVLSWDEQQNGPDTTPDNEDDKTSTRAYIRALSRKHPTTGVITESTMNVRDSLIHHLGYFGNMAYGLSWKAIVRNDQDISILEEFDVFGDMTGNEIHHLHYGFYSYGGFEMNISNNHIYENNVYGIDPHDDSDFLIIHNNNVHDNGKHGIICSKRCNNIEITDNISSNNGEHGIMLHYIVDHSIVTGNTANNNGDDGIAIYESNHNIVSGNTVEGNSNGIRLSMGSSFNLIENNTIRNNTDNGIRTFRGNDDPHRIAEDGVTACDRISRSNTFKGNDISGSGNWPIRINDSDKNLFRDNTIDDPKVRVSSGQNNTFINNEFTETPTFTLDADGDTSRPSLVYLSGDTGFDIDEEDGSQGIILGN